MALSAVEFATHSAGELPLTAYKPELMMLMMIVTSVPQTTAEQ